MVDQRVDEADIVEVLGLRVTAADAGVPRGLDALRVHYLESLPFSQCVEFGPRFEVSGQLGVAMKRDHERNLPFRIEPRRPVVQVKAPQVAKIESGAHG